MGRPLRTTLDIVKAPRNKELSSYSQQMLANYNKKASERRFKVGQQVCLRNYNPNQDKWVPGIVTEEVSSNTYRVHYGTGSRVAHADQLKKRVCYWEEIPPERITKEAQRQNAEEDVHSSGDGLRRSTRKRKMTEKMNEYVRGKRTKVNRIAELIGAETLHEVGCTCFKGRESDVSQGNVVKAEMGE